MTFDQMILAASHGDREAEFAVAVAQNHDAWVAACGGTETPYVSRSGRRVLYVFNPAQGRHAYMDLDRDMILDVYDPMEV